VSGLQFHGVEYMKWVRVAPLLLSLTLTSRTAAAHSPSPSMLPSSSARETALSYRQLAPILKIVFASSYYKQLASHEDRAGAGGFFWNTKHGQRVGVEVHLFNEWGDTTSLATGCSSTMTAMRGPPSRTTRFPIRRATDRLAIWWHSWMRSGSGSWNSNRLEKQQRWSGSRPSHDTQTWIPTAHLFFRHGGWRRVC